MMGPDVRVFVTGTGRCGTCTFYQACRHLTNYTAGHESDAGSLTPADWPDRHVEVSSTLAWSMALLVPRYPGAVWVHLVRERGACVRSLAAQCPVQVEQWAQLTRHAFRAGRHAAAGAYYDAVNAAVAALLPTDRSMTFRVEDAAAAWPAFWRLIGGAGDLRAAAAEWGRAYNAGRRRGRDEWVKAGGAGC